MHRMFADDVGQLYICDPEYFTIFLALTLKLQNSSNVSSEIDSALGFSNVAWTRNKLSA